MYHFEAYLPYFDSRQEEFSEFEVSPRDSGHAQIYYTSVTSGGQSGGNFDAFFVEILINCFVVEVRCNFRIFVKITGP